MSSSPGSSGQMDLYDHCQRSEERKEYIKEGFKEYDEYFNKNIKSNAETMEKQKKALKLLLLIFILFLVVLIFIMTIIIKLSSCYIIVYQRFF